MSWLRLLAVSRSFSSIEDRPTRFKMKQQNLLPKFGPTDPEGACGAAGTSLALAEEAASGREGTDAGAASPKKGRSMETNAVQCASAEPAPAAYPGGRWRILRNPFGRAGQGGNGPAPVQGELKLELVKVIRNDLTDSDLQLIGPRPPALAGEAASEPGVGEGSLQDRLWRRVKETLSGF